LNGDQPFALFAGLVDSAAWPALRMVLHLGLLLTALLVLKGALELALGRPGGRGARRGARRAAGLISVPLIGLAVLFAVVLAHQASWQLTGLFRPQLVAFMQSHDRRQFNPVHRIRRGRILDRNGEVLAYSAERDGQVVRVYPYGPAFAHVVGYSHPRYGATGTEAAANAWLNGAAPESLASWGELGRQLVMGTKDLRGQDLVLTLDARIQQAAVEALGDRRGAAVLLRPRDGAVLALVTSPSFDPNGVGPDLFRVPGEGSPLLNRATQGLYPPGSTFKVLLAALALESGFSGTLDCPAEGYTTSSYYPRIRDHDYYSARERGGRFAGHGRLDLDEAFVESSNVFFAQLGVKLGRDAFLAAGERFAFDRQITLYPASGRGVGRDGNMGTGRIPRLKERDLYGLAQASIGQGRMLATPAHMALIAAAVANGGLAMRPRLIASAPPEPLGQFMSPAAAERLARMMRRVVKEGTGRGIETPGLPIAGKTGTAQNPRGAAHGWFIGFAPAGRVSVAPELAVAVLVEHGGYGSQSAAPIARDLLRLGLSPGPGG
jgi:peptidoglycan glycosyltransferase